MWIMLCSCVRYWFDVCRKVFFLLCILCSLVVVSMCGLIDEVGLRW